MISPPGSVANIRRVLRSATPKEWHAGSHWYSVFLADIRREARRVNLPTTKADIRRYAGIVAAFSPQRSPNVNMQLFIRFACERRFGWTWGVSNGHGYHTSPQERKAEAIADGADPEAVLTGPKESAFFHAIMGDQQSCVIDGHAYAVWLGKRVGTHKIKVPRHKSMNHISCVEAYRTVARHRGLAASQVQAITWLAWRRIHQSESTQRGLRAGRMVTHA